MDRDFKCRISVFGETDKIQPQIAKIEPLQVARGETIKFTGNGFPTDAKDITVTLNGKDIGNAWDTGKDETDTTKSYFRFLIPGTAHNTVQQEV